MQISEPISTDAGPSKLLRAKDVASILDISRAMAYRLMQQGIIRTVRIAGSRRVRATDLETFIKDNLYPPRLA